MDTLSAMRSLADLQAKFQPTLLSFDPEALLALTSDIDGASDAPISPSHDFPTCETASSAQLFDYRGEKVAGFEVNGIQMICLPQNMVGGLHTVYTKLKRLEISPLICNVEQVRALRGLGAIQPGVNRCKLIASSDFDKLYEDCTNTCTRPGRPPKRSLPLPEDWSIQKKEAQQGENLMNCSSSTYADEMSPHLTVQNPLLLSNFLPQFTAHQLLVQQMIALASQQQRSFEPQPSGNEDEGPSNILPADMVEDVSTPLNLTKANSNSETCDSDSLENLRKVDSSLSPSQYNSSDRGGSSSHGSNNSPSSDTSAALNKIMSLIDVANEHFKEQKECIQKEREELTQLRAQLKDSLSDENELREQLEKEKRRSSSYFRLYCKAKKEAFQLKERLLKASPQPTQV